MHIYTYTIYIYTYIYTYVIIHIYICVYICILMYSYMASHTLSASQEQPTHGVRSLGCRNDLRLKGQAFCGDDDDEV